MVYDQVRGQEVRVLRGRFTLPSRPLGWWRPSPLRGWSGLSKRCLCSRWAALRAATPPYWRVPRGKSAKLAREIVGGWFSTYRRFCPQMAGRVQSLRLEHCMWNAFHKACSIRCSKECSNPVPGGVPWRRQRNGEGGVSRSPAPQERQAEAAGGVNIRGRSYDYGRSSTQALSLCPPAQRQR